MPRKRKDDGAEAPAGSRTKRSRAKQPAEAPAGSRANSSRAGQPAAAHHADPAAAEIVTPALRLVAPHEVGGEDGGRVEFRIL